MGNEQPTGAVIGVAYFQKDEWERFLSTADDRDALEETYEEWQASVERLARNARKVGAQLRKVPVSVDEILDYCRREQVAHDAEARTALVAQLLQAGRGEPLDPA